MFPKVGETTPVVALTIVLVSQRGGGGGKYVDALELRHREALGSPKPLIDPIHMCPSVLQPMESSDRRHTENTPTFVCLPPQNLQGFDMCLRGQPSPLDRAVLHAATRKQPLASSTLGHQSKGCRARHATFLLTIPTSAPDLPSHGEAPQVDHVALHTFPTKHVA